MTKHINIVRDFHPFPAGRYVEDGDGNGTAFRDEFLMPAIINGEDIEIDLDGAPGYPSSFLEEAFGGLVRAQVPKEVIRKHVKFHASKAYKRYEGKIWSFVEQATADRNAAPAS